MTHPPLYDIVFSAETLANIKQYKNDISSGKAAPGARMKTALAKAPPTTEGFIEALLATKQPRIFAESEIRADGTDWNHRELALLGGINVTMKAEFFDNGAWSTKDAHFREHKPPLEGELLFTPGALLNTGAGFDGVSPDEAEVTTGGKIDQKKYDALVERRLLPLLAHANEAAKKDGKPAFVTLPGLGAGAFAGRFRGQMGAHLDTALQNLLEKHGDSLPHIGAVYFDPFAECGNFRKDFHGIDYRVRPATQNPGRPQLSAPEEFQEAGDDFSGHRLYKIVAWDHASLPGNDFFAGARQTDDGVSAAASDSMKTMTGISGTYANGHYAPPAGYATWEEVADDKSIHLLARGNVKIVSHDGTYATLDQYEQGNARPRRAAPGP